MTDFNKKHLHRCPKCRLQHLCPEPHCWEKIFSLCDLCRYGMSRNMALAVNLFGGGATLIVIYWFFFGF